MINKLLNTFTFAGCILMLVMTSACSDNKSVGINSLDSRKALSIAEDQRILASDQKGNSVSVKAANPEQKLVNNPTTHTIKIMPFGDSITSGNTYRKPLWDLLKNSNISNIDFVGSLNGNSTPDGDHEGHACYKIVYVLIAPGSGTFKKCTPNENSAGDFTDLQTWFSSSKPDIVLWHIGTNDAASKEDPSNVMSAFSATLSKLRQRNPKVTILVAKILPMTVADVRPLNAAIPDWAAANSTVDSKIVVVDMNTGFDPSLTYDGIHPNTAGGKWMADRWFEALKSVLG